MIGQYDYMNPLLNFSSASIDKGGQLIYQEQLTWLIADVWILTIVTLNHLNEHSSTIRFIHSIFNFDDLVGDISWSISFIDNRSWRFNVEELSINRYSNRELSIAVARNESTRAWCNIQIKVVFWNLADLSAPFVLVPQVRNSLLSVCFWPFDLTRRYKPVVTRIKLTKQSSRSTDSVPWLSSWVSALTHWRICPLI